MCRPVKQTKDTDHNSKAIDLTAHPHDGSEMEISADEVTSAHAYFLISCCLYIFSMKQILCVK